MKRLTTKEFIENARAVHGTKYSYGNVVYQRSCMKVSITCPQHGDWLQRPNDHLTGYGCPSCKFDKTAGIKRSNINEFVERANVIHGEYDYSNVQYINAITKVEIICIRHGAFFQTPDKHLSGTMCPKCSNGMSRGERQIQKLLEEKGIEYEFNKTFPGLHGRTKNAALRYDFYLPSYNLLIEYDGEHHFKPVRTKGRLTTKQAIERHEVTKINDKKKNRYAIKNGIELLRIKYNQDINDVLAFLH